MSTIAAIGLGEPGNWTGTLVMQDGYPSFVGRELLNLVAEHAGDLEAAWSHLSTPPYGWSTAFREPHEDLDYLANYCSGEGANLVQHDSPWCWAKTRTAPCSSV